MNKWNRKLNKFFKKYTTPFTFIAGTLTVLGYVMQHFTNMTALTVIFYSIATVFAGLPILFRAITGLKAKAIGIEVLVTIAVIGALFLREYSEAAIVTFLFQFGTYLEQRTLKKTRSAIKLLTEMAPATAWRIESPESEPEKIDADEVEEGDLLLVKAGGKVAVDGIIEFGEGYLNEASINGESVPAHKTMGDLVYAGTILDSGTLHMRATRVGEDTTFSKIIALVEEAQDAKSPAERFIDRFAKWYTPSVVVIAVLVFLFTRNLATAITVLVLACPGALVIGAPVANVAGIGRGARDSILLKGGDSVTTFAKVDTFVFDKTGTLTIGHPDVTGIYQYTDDLKHALKLAATLEGTSDHPLAKAIVNYTKEQQVTLEEAVSSETLKGLGIRALVNGSAVLAGNERLITEQGISLTDEQKKHLRDAQEKGASTVFIAENGRILLLFAISDKIKDAAADMIAELKRLGIKKTIMLTGDNRKTAEAVAKQIGIDEALAELLPEDKLTTIQELQKQGKNVVFVGDGVNDSPALAAADTGIAMGGGTDVAVETSDVVLMRSNLESIPMALKLAKRTVRILYQNIFIAVATVLLLLVGLFAGYIHMASGMFIHEASILVVIFNAMRLLYRKNHKSIVQ